jgi:hypothetical protein
MPEPQQTFRADERPFDRRAFLRGSLLVVGGVALARIPVAAGARPSAQLEGFLEVSRIAAGAEKLPVGLAPEYLAALDAAPLKLKPSRFVELAGYGAGKGPKNLRALEQSPAFKADGGKACVEAIVAAWWSGMVPVAGGGQKVVTFSDALVWREVHEPTTCQGATGSWAKPGRAVL